MSLTHVAPIDEFPFYIVLNDNVTHIGLARAQTYEIMDARGLRLYQETHRAGLSDVIMLTDGFIQSYAIYGWGARDQVGGLFTGGDLLWALAYDWGVRWAAITTYRPFRVHPQDSTMSPAQTRIAAGDFLRENAIANLHMTIPGSGCGAIAQNQRYALSMRDGRFLVYNGNATFRDPVTGGISAERLVEVQVDYAAYDMSIVESGYALLEAGPERAHVRPFTSFEGELAMQARRNEFPQRPPPRWTTVVHHLDLQGQETWRHVVPFEVLQPPIDGGNGRVYVMGMGAAAIQDGKLLFSVASDLPMFGTAFNDGHLAVAVGQELRIVDGDSNIVQKFTTLEHEAITTPPAIGSDGSVWVGTSKGIYVAR